MQKRCLPIAGFLVLSLVVGGNAHSQEDASDAREGLSAQATASGGDARSRMEVTRSMIRTERQKIVAEAMALSEKEAERFWPLYREFSQDLTQLNDRQAELLTKYAKSYPNVSAEEASRMLDELLDIQADEVELKQRYVPKFRKVLPDVKVTRYFQLENKLDAVLRLELAEAVPLVL